MALLMMVFHGSSIGTKPKEHSWGLMLLRFQEYEETARLSFQAIDTPVAVCVTEALFTAGLGGLPRVFHPATRVRNVRWG